jgi:hypothetical protein
LPACLLRTISKLIGSGKKWGWSPWLHFLLQLLLPPPTEERIVDPIPQIPKLSNDRTRAMGGVEDHL